jgi:hypothetical protein
MGLLSETLAPFLADSQQRTPLFYAGVFAFFISALVATNIFKQLAFKNPNEPPVVFHIFPFIGSTVTYGIDPIKFFNRCQAKVRLSGVRDISWDMN